MWYGGSWRSRLLLPKHFCTALHQIWPREVRGLRCGHAFHEACLERWLRTLQEQDPTARVLRCPLCRGPQILPRFLCWEHALDDPYLHQRVRQADPTPATRSIWAQLKAGECVRLYLVGSDSGTSTVS